MAKPDRPNLSPRINNRKAMHDYFIAAKIECGIVLVGSEVNPVIHALRAHGIEVTALHSHMLTEQPRLFFMHFWANDDAGKLAEGLRAALNETKTASGQ